jgi:hypothetical protein
MCENHAQAEHKRVHHTEPKLSDTRTSSCISHMTTSGDLHPSAVIHLL